MTKASLPNNSAQTGPTASDVVTAVDQVVAIATDLGRDDFGHRLVVAAARVRRPATIVCVVGEFKQGKSSLINAMLGVEICPVDDDVATSATTLVRYGEELLVEVRRRTEEGIVVESVEPATLVEWVSERGNPDNVRNVERVDISLPHPLLADGLAIVDTPGMGGLGAGHAAATLAFLPFADGLIFVTDASAELSQPESEFLDRAAELCPNIAFVLTKTDLYPSWRDVAAIDAGHIAGRSLGPDGERPIMPVSATLFGTDMDPADEAMAAMSGVPSLLSAINSWVVVPAKAVAAQRAIDEAGGVLDQLQQQLQVELEVLQDPGRIDEIIARLAAATSHLEQLRGPGARWGIVVADRLSDLSSSSGHQFRLTMRSIARDIEDAIELLKTPDDWDLLARRLQTDVAEAVTTVFVSIERGARDTRQAVVDLIGEDAIEASPLAARREPSDPASMWLGKGIDPVMRRGGQQLGSALVGLRGAQGGIIMFGMLGQFLPAGAAALMMSNPITISIGAVFAGMQLADAHKRKIAVRRQQARGNVRQFLDDVQFAVGNEISDLMRVVQRDIRDEFTERISELVRTYADTVQVAQRAAHNEGEAAEQRIVAIRSTLERIDRAGSSLAGLLVS